MFTSEHKACSPKGQAFFITGNCDPETVINKHLTHKIRTKSS
jgi:hypothetical protein